MKLEYPLESLIKYCETNCVAGCCGIDAYDFSPVHIASFLAQSSGATESSLLETLISQIGAIEAHYGIHGQSANEAIFEDLNIVLKGIQVDRFCHELQVNLDVALKLVEQGTALRYKTPPDIR